ncbi:MAG: ABC transporter ATP-binding protein [Coriobacteriia bacterium]|nr:ABC transporter ATP-binding protein [Coriobacteriia bacterium]
MEYLELIDVVKEYHTGDVAIRAADGVSFAVKEGHLATVVGPSGAGKSTILNILGGMDRADGGTVSIDGLDVAGLDRPGLTKYRRTAVGFVFQFYNLIPNLTALENVELAAQICPGHRDALETLELVGLGERSGHFPAQLSGGEQQRVAIARALAKNPKLLLCDEPTGALDYHTGKLVLKLLQQAAREQGVTVVIVTHNLALTAMGDLTIQIRNGRVEGITKNAKPSPVDRIEW